MLQLILGLGEDANRQDKTGKTALFHLVEFCLICYYSRGIQSQCDGLIVLGLGFILL